jgi:hypothetical protein
MSIMDMLGQAGGGAPPPDPSGAPPAGPDPAMGGQPPSPDASAGGDDPTNIIRDMLDLLNEYKASEEDEEDLLLVEKIGTQLQQLLANNQKELDGAMKGTISPKLLRKQYASG